MHHAMRIQNMCYVQVLNTKETMDEQQIIREEQGVARRREQDRERRARAGVEETPEQREQRVAQCREQDREC